MTDFEFMLEDRIAKIKAINEQYDLEHNAYISFSGGKDSTILHYLLDIALPNNKIPRLFINTGVEYKAIREFVKNLSLKDERIIILNSNVNIKQILNKNGYPFKSKQHSHNMSIFENNKNEIRKYISMIEQDKELLKNYDFIHSLPNGVKSLIKYFYGVREKEELTEVLLEREREREHYIYKYNDYP